MDKITTYLAVLGTVILLFYFGGLVENTPSSILLNVLVHPSGISNTPFWLATLTITGILTGGGIAASLYISGKQDMAIRVLLAPTLIAIGWDIIAIFLKVSDYNTMVATIILAPLVLVYFLSLVEWITGLSS